MEIIWVLAFMFVFMTMAFVVIAVFLPEWVGIQGKKAKTIEEGHQEDAPSASVDLNKK